MNTIELLPLLGQAGDIYTADGQEISAAGAAGILALLMIPILISLVLSLIMIIGMWKVFDKAGKPGWAAIIPIYNMIVWQEVTGRPVWWFILLFIPVVGFVIWFIVSIDMAKSFGKDTGFGVGIALIPFILLPMLGFGSAQYVGPAAAEGEAVAA